MNTRTYAALARDPKARLAWVQPDTRWDVHPAHHAPELALFSDGAWWLPTPGGDWFRARTGLVEARAAHGPALFGSWATTPISGLLCHGKQVTVTSYQRHVTP